MADPVAKNELDIEEVALVSLVPRGDNPEAHVLIAKADPRNPGDETAAATVGAMATKTQPDSGAPAPEGGNAETQVTVSGDFAKYAKALEEQNELLRKALEDEAADLGDEDDGDGDDDDEGADDDEPVAKSTPASGDLDTILKANPELAKAFEGMRAEVENLKKQTTRAEDIAKAEREARELVEFGKRAEALAPLADDETGTEGLTKTLHKVFKALDVDTYIALEKVLAKAAVLAEGSDEFIEKGDSGAGDDDDNKFAQLMAKARQPGVIDGDDELSFEQRAVALMRAEPNLYDELTGSNGRQGGAR